MQKLRRIVLDRMISEQLTSRQTDMMLYLSNYQDETGLVQGVYYRAVCADTGMSIQSFYNALAALEHKGLISKEKNSETDWDVRILDNDCSDYSKGKVGQYLNTNQEMFYSKAFRALSGGAKLLAVYLLRRCGENRGRYSQQVGTFLDDLKKKFRVSIRVIVSYLKELQSLFSLGSKDGLYFIRPLKAGIQKTGKSEYQKKAEHEVDVICRRQKIETPSTHREKADLAGLMNQYKQPSEKLQEAILTAICVEEESAKNRSEKRHIQANLKPAKKSGKQKLPAVKLVHKVLRGMLGLDKPVQGTVITEN